MQVWNVLHAARWKFRTQTWRKKNRHLRTIAQLCRHCRAVSSQLRHVSTIGKGVKQQYLLYMSPQYGELRPTKRLRSVREFFGTTTIKFQRVSRLGFVTKLCTMFGCLLGWYTIYTFSGVLALWRNFARCKIHFTSKSCILLHWQHYCTALQQRVSAKLCGVYKEWNYGTFAEGAIYMRLGSHHAGHQPTF